MSQESEQNPKQNPTDEKLMQIGGYISGVGIQNYSAIEIFSLMFQKIMAGVSITNVKVVEYDTDKFFQNFT